MTLDEVKTLTDVAGSVATVVALAVGGFWAYFKFIKGRQFRPHVQIAVAARWLGDNGSLGLQVGVRLENIGSAKVVLLHRGTAVILSRISEEQRRAPAETQWAELGVYDIFLKHDWIEPGEAINDELLVRLPIAPEVLQIQTRVVLAWSPENISVHARRIVSSPGDVLPAPSSALPQTKED